MAASLNANCRLTQESQNGIARIISHTESQRHRDLRNPELPCLAYNLHRNCENA